MNNIFKNKASDNPYNLEASARVWVIRPDDLIYDTLKSGQTNDLHNRDIVDKNVATIQQSLDRS